ncbi:hypothetical protein EDEG_03630 [Edhazardia aedis USNM 41457]|uniref:Uncharacterized protein n=1 Tax=Edhazardia aedis (strain USNM 41457) TaxID=1003232 RepID=J9DH15_EDHAE|nr:hypothetical protein EDEG_03630 [Edhazardia aedis USNM 41457]|eukprot:EJW01895.1 hypothetical protein EDEG_03630 [Edhazardia aedis USNM 41457]
MYTEIVKAINLTVKFFILFKSFIIRLLISIFVWILKHIMSFIKNILISKNIKWNAFLSNEMRMLAGYCCCKYTSFYQIYKKRKICSNKENKKSNSNTFSFLYL